MRPAEGTAGVAAQMGGVDGPVSNFSGQIHQRVVGGGRLGGQGVHGNAADAAIQQALTHRQVVHQIAPGGVHQDNARFHLGDQVGVHHVPGLVVDRTVERENITSGGQLLQGPILHPELRLYLGGTAVEAVIVHLAAKGLEPPGSGLSDVAKAHQAHSLLAQLRAAGGHDRLLHLHLAARLHRVVAGDAVAQGHEHEHNGVLRHGIGVAPLVVAHEDPLFFGRLQGDAVEGHALRLDELQVGQQVNDLPAHVHNGVVKEHLSVGVVRRRLAGRLIQRTKHQLRPQLGGKVGHVGVITGLGAVHKDLQWGSSFILSA